MQQALQLTGVSKRYASHEAVRDLTLSVPSGVIYGILGPNGAGKSSTIRIAMGIIAHDSGEVRLLGRDPAVDRRVLGRVGYLPEERGLYRKMRVREVIAFFGGLKGMSRSEALREADAWLERMGLHEWRRSRVDTLSKGMQQKVQFISTVVHRPDLLFLDEPGSGLDPVNQEVLRDTILQARDQGRTVILSTHNMAEAEQLCDSVCIIAEGRKVLDGSLREIRRAHRGNRWAVELEDESEHARAWLAHGPFAALQRNRRWEVELPPGEDPRSLLAAVAELDATVLRVERVQPTLHEIFVERVGAAAAVPRHREAVDA